MIKKIIMGNWKMYPLTVKDAREKFTKIKKVAGTLRNVQTIVCPPFIFLNDLKKLTTGHRCAVGAQDSAVEAEGAHTGEVSPLMLSNAGISYVILGHSERRSRGETDEIINTKILTAVKAGLTVVLCVGERERDADGDYLKHIATQIKIALKGIQKKDVTRIIVAYEPIWAIGKNALRSASTDDALEVSILIKKTLVGIFSKDGSTIPILYGGSVDTKNASDFLAKSQVDGLLVGRASLDPNVFNEILKSADKIK